MGRRSEEVLKLLDLSENKTGFNKMVRRLCKNSLCYSTFLRDRYSANLGKSDVLIARMNGSRKTLLVRSNKMHDSGTECAITSYRHIRTLKDTVYFLD